MEKMDTAMAARVWQRVRGEATAPEAISGLQGLAAAEMAEAAALAQMSGMTQGRSQRVLRQLAQQDRAHAACLKGIQAMAMGSAPHLRTAPPVPEEPETALRKCCGRKMKALAQYEARAQDPEFGCMFAELARQERAHCCQLLELLGMQAEPGSRL